MIIINRPGLCSRLKIWHPRYSDQWQDEPRVLISKAKAHHSSPIIIIEFTKAKSLIGQRFAITRNKVEKYPIVSNGKIDCYAVPLHELDNWMSRTEENQAIINDLKELSWL